MSLTLKIQIVRINQLKAMKFAPTMSVSEACAQIMEKTSEGGEDHGLYQPGLEGKRPPRWLRMDRTLQYYDLKLNDQLDFKKKHRPIKVRLMDDTVKTVLIDDSLTVGEIVELIGKKMGIKNYEEFSLQVDGLSDWLNITQPLHEQGVTDEQQVVLKKKFFVDDANISRDDPVQLHLVYVQSRDAIVGGTHPCTYDESIQFAALQCQVQLGNHNPASHKPGFLRVKEFLAPTAAKNKNAEKDIYNEFRKLVGMSEVNAKYRYVQLCRSLKTYGLTIFHTKERGKGQKKPVAKLLGITRDAILRLDAETKEVEHEYPLTHLRRWAASPASFTLDFGDYEEEYVSVITNEGEAISQLLSGYIDILLKKRKDTGVVLDDNDNDVANVESVGRIRGQAGSAITSSSQGGFDSGSGREGQYSAGASGMARRGTGAPQALQVNNVDTAQTAIANMILELDATPLPVPGAMSHLSPQQWRQQLQQHCKAVAAAAGKLGSIGAQPQNIDRSAMNNVAKELYMTIDSMVNSARNASASEGEDPDGEMPLMDGAKAVAEAIARMLKATKDMANNPDQQAIDKFKAAQEILSASMNFLNGAVSGSLADLGTTHLIAESAKAIAAATNDLIGATRENMGDLDKTVQNRLANVANAAEQASQNCLAVSTTLAAAVLDANCKRMIIESAKAVQAQNSTLIAAARTSGLDPQLLGLNDAAKAVSDAIAQLLGVTEIAEPRTGSDPEFGESARIIANNTGLLMGAKGKSDVMNQAAKAIAEAMPGLIAGAKRAAQKSEDDAVKQRLLAMAKQVAEAVKGLTDVVQPAAQNPNDQAAFSKMQEAARKLAALTNQLTGDAAKTAALQQLRTNSKHAAAATTSLVAAARSAVPIMSDNAAESQALQAAAKAAADAIQKLIKPLQDAQKSPDSPEVFAALVEASKKVVPIGYKLVATAKQASPAIPVNYKTKKEDLAVAANAAAEALKNLNSASSGVAAGDENFDNALEQLQAMVADLESEVFEVQSGTLTPSGQTKEDAIEFMNAAVKVLGNAAKNLVVAAKTDPDSLGPKSSDLASAVQQVVNSSKSVAGSVPNRATQKAVLTAGKELASQSESLVSTARALSSTPKDVNLSNALTNSAKGVADTIAKLIQATKNADPTGKDIDEALNAIKQSAALLNASPVNTGGDYPTQAEKLAKIAKALSAASAQIVNTATSNPAALGGVAKTTASIIPDLVECTNSAAGSAPNKQQSAGIVAATKNVTTDIAKLLNAARNKQPGNDPQFTSAAKAIADSIKGLLSKLENASPAQREVAAALEAAREAVARLSQPNVPDVPAPLDSITKAAKALAEAAAQIVSSREAPEKVGAMAKKAADSLSAMIDSAKAASAAASGQSSEGLEALAKKVQDTCAQMANASNAPTLDDNAKKAIIAAAKNAALATSGLVGAARSSAVALKASDPEGSKALLNSAQSVANITAKLVNLAKGAAAGKPANKAETAKVTKELNEAIFQLLQNSGNAPSSSTIDMDSLTPNAQNLINAAQAVGNATTQLLEAGHKAAGGSKDNATFTAMSTAAKGVTNAIQGVVNAANGLKPGQKELEDAIEAIQNASVELDSASLNAAIGLLENSAPAGTTLQKAQEDLVETTKELANAIKDVVTAAKSAPDKLGEAAKSTAHTVPRLAAVAKACAGLTSDNAQQQEQLSNAKTLADTLLELMVAAKAGNMHDLSLHAKSASQAITNVISPIKPGVLGSKDCDDAIASVKDTIALLGKPPGRPTKTYAECQAEMNNVSKALVGSLSALVNAAKAKPEEVGGASKKVASVIPDLVELTMMAVAAASDAESKKSLTDGTRNIANAASNVINDAKLVAADRKNAALQTQLGTSFKTITAAIGQFVATIKAAPASERDVDVALDEISKTMADLDSAALFAAAGQLEADVSGQSLESCQNELLNASKAIAQACAALTTAAKGTPEQLGAASKNLAKAITNLAKLTKATACLAGDSVSQQSLLTAARAVSISGQQAVLAARQAQKSGNPADQTSLAASSTAVSEAVGQLINFAQTASADASKGIVELDNAAAEIRKLLGAFDTPNFKGNEKATAEDVVTAAKQVAESTAMLVSACNNSPEDIYTAAKSTHQSTKLLLENSKGAAHLSDDQVVQQNLRDSAKAVANATAKLVGAAKSQRGDAQNPAAQQKLSTTSSEVIDKINDVVAVAGDLPGGERAKKLFATAENLEEIAEKELLTAASVIEQATKVLLDAKRRAQEKREQMGLDETGIDEAILEAARAIAQATSILVSAATSAQKEIVLAGKSSKATNVYRRDPTWARGLISAAQSVAGSVQSLVGSANQASQGQAEEEQLVASARGVAAATARLVSASRAKADPSSATQQKLSSAAKSVASATSDLVAAAKAAGEMGADAGDTTMDLSGLSATGQKVKEMEQQVKILKLRKELENAQKQLFSIRKSDYDDATTPAPVMGATKPAPATHATASTAKPGPRPLVKPPPSSGAPPGQPPAAPLKRSGELPTPGSPLKKAAAPGGENSAPPMLKKAAPLVKKPAASPPPAGINTSR